MVDVVVSFCVDKLKQQISAEIEMLASISADVVWIKGELESMKAFLIVAEKRRDRHDGVKAWVDQVRRLAFDAEDAVDEFMIQMDMPDRLENPIMRCLVFCGRFLNRFLAEHRFGTKMQSIRREATEIRDRKDRYQIETTPEEGRSSNSASLDPGAAAPYVEEADIVGLEDEATKLQQLLKVDETEERAVISIVGAGGLGKTTLAKKVYKDVQLHFEYHAWVSVSQTFQTKDLLKKMLRGFFKNRNETPPSDMEMMVEADLRETILKYLQKKKYALVLDDIWKTDAWIGVKHALPHEGGRIIFTTRNSDIASLADDKYYIQELQPLSPDLAWKLFCKKAFRKESNRGDCPDYLTTAAEAMVRRCNGLPQAIVAIGGLMSKRGTNPSDWNEVLENLDYELSQDPDLAELNRVLVASYIYLPSHMKYCFLYCAMFPEDHVIGREKLIRLWVAEGFIEENPPKTRTHEELANSYFIQLIDRNLLLPVLDDYTLRVQACQMHDLMREVAISMFKREEFAAVVTKQSNHEQEMQRRLAIQCKPTDIPRISIPPNPRAFLMFSKGEFPSSLLCRMISDFKLLRVLDLDGSAITSLPNEIGALIHLRYLSLRSTRIAALPESLKRLHNLQTLDVSGCDFESFPASITNLVQLRHLVAVDMKMPRGISNLRNLQTISSALVDDELLGELGELKQVRELRLNGVKQRQCRQLCDSISQLQHLRCIEMVCSYLSESEELELEQLQLESLSQPPQYLEELYLHGTMSKFPGWIGSLNCVREIHLRRCRLLDDPLQILGQLHNLLVLHLADQASLKEKMVVARGGFPKLRWLIIENMDRFEEIGRIEKGELQSLEVLVISECPMLMLPDGLQHIATMKRLQLEDMDDDFINRIKRGGLDHFKVQHIPVITHKYFLDDDYVTEQLS